jgi:hypothetical protein
VVHRRQVIMREPCRQVSRNVERLEHSRASFLTEVVKTREWSKQAVHRGLSRIMVGQTLEHRCRAEGHEDHAAVLIVDLWRSDNTDSTSCSEDSLRCIAGRRVASSRRGGGQR